MERVFIILTAVGFLIGGTAPGETEPEQPNAIAVIQLDPTEEEAAQELITWEMVKLGVAGGSLPLQIPKGSSLESTLRAKLKEADPDSKKKPDSPLTLSDLRTILKDSPELNLKDSHELLGFLRLQASGKKLDDPQVKDTLKQSALGELAKVVAERPDGEVKVPERLRAPLADALAKVISKDGETVPERAELLERLKGPEDLLRALREAEPSSFSVEDLAELSGSLRSQGRKLRGARFAEDIRDEAGELLAAIRRARPQDPLATPPAKPFPSISSRPSFTPGSNVSPPPLVQRNGGFGSRSPFSGRHGGGAPQAGGRGAGSPGTGSIALSGAPPRDTALTGSQESRLDNLKARGHVSLQMRTVYDNNYRVVSACQITAVNRPRTIPNSDNRCQYDMATALHCVEKDGKPFTDIAISPLKNLTVTRAQADNLGQGDLAMLEVEADCADIPWVPLALQSPRGGEEILVHASVPLKGQAETNAIASNLMMMNTNHPDNNGINVVQGNSGGAVTNGRGELVGVISSVMLTGSGPNARQVPGIGFFATRDSLEFANAFVNPNFKPQVLGSASRLPDVSLSQASADTH